MGHLSARHPTEELDAPQMIRAMTLNETELCCVLLLTECDSGS